MVLPFHGTDINITNNHLSFQIIEHNNTRTCDFGNPSTDDERWYMYWQLDFDSKLTIVKLLCLVYYLIFKCWLRPSALFNRTDIIHMTTTVRLRNKCSSLNSDLFKSKLVPSASCSCGYKNECSEHFLLYCNKFNLLRNNMLIELNMLDMGGLPVNIDIFCL